MLRVDGTCALTNGTLFCACSFAAWSAFAVTCVALDGAVSSALGAVLHLGVFDRIGRAGLDSRNGTGAYEATFEG